MLQSQTPQRHRPFPAAQRIKQPGSVIRLGAGRSRWMTNGCGRLPKPARDHYHPPIDHIHSPGSHRIATNLFEHLPRREWLGLTFIRHLRPNFRLKCLGVPWTARGSTDKEQRRTAAPDPTGTEQTARDELLYVHTRVGRSSLVSSVIALIAGAAVKSYRGSQYVPRSSYARWEVPSTGLA